LRPWKAWEKTPKGVIPSSLCEISQNASRKKRIAEERFYCSSCTGCSKSPSRCLRGQISGILKDGKEGRGKILLKQLYIYRVIIRRLIIENHKSGKPGGVDIKITVTKAKVFPYIAAWVRVGRGIAHVKGCNSVLRLGKIHHINYSMSDAINRTV
jgi:hypothetical protein